MTPKVPKTSNLSTTEQLDMRELEKRGELAEQLLSFLLGDDPDRTIWIGASLSRVEQDQLLDFLRKNVDIFAWSAFDMPGILPEVIIYQLRIDSKFKLVRQKKRNFVPERQKAINEEVDKLLMAGFIREAHYPEWLANVVMIKKSNRKGWIGIDFTDLNKACPKDSFSLSRINQLVDATSGHKRLSFMDAFSGYNQIKMATEDEENTAFVIDNGIYFYKVMPFGLKNVVPPTKGWSARSSRRKSVKIGGVCRRHAR